MPTVFTRIMAGDLPARFVWRDPVCVSFLSVNPLGHGHVLVVPRKEVDDWVDLDDSTRDHVFKVAQLISRALKRAYGSPKVGLVLAGLEVAHVHVHLVPIFGIRDLDSANQNPNPDPDQLEADAGLIRRTLAEAGLVEVGAEPEAPAATA